MLFSPALALSASVHPLFNVSAPQGGPLPSDRFTVPDPTQNTELRINLPKPDCGTRPSDCADLDVLNELDGFNLLPRLSIPFDGPIDLATANSSNVFLVSLGSTLPGGEPSGHRVGIDQIVWDPPSAALHVESDELLDQHTRYVLVVTKDVHDPAGKEIKAAKAFVDFVDETLTASTGDPALDLYRAELRDALAQIDARGIVSRGQVVAASVFTTLSASANLEKMRDQIKSAAAPAPANFLLGTGDTRTLFPRSTVTRWVFRRQISTDPDADLDSQTIPQVLNAVLGRWGEPPWPVQPPTIVHPGEFIPWASGTASRRRAGAIESSFSSSITSRASRRVSSPFTPMAVARTRLPVGMSPRSLRQVESRRSRSMHQASALVH
jgi:hypothetical protein